jgi:hypothetical protein
MGLIHFNFENKTLIIFITSIVLGINFRSTFKNVDLFMDLGDYPSPKFNPRLILIKNIFSSFFLLLFYIQNKFNISIIKNEKKIVKTKIDDIIIMEEKEEILKEGFLDLLYRFHRLSTKKQRIVFVLKHLFIIIIIYFIEEAYFIIANNHVMDSIVCAMRNLSIFMSLIIFYYLIFKKCYAFYRHQVVPLIINIVFSLILILINAFHIDRFWVLFNTQNLIIYFSLFGLLGLEMILIKYLIDRQSLSILMILGIKGLIGTLVFSIINIFYNKRGFFQLLDDIIKFEYEDMYEEFPVMYNLFYVLSLLIFQYLKFYTISELSETHYSCSLMITDIGFFIPFNIERIFIQGFDYEMDSFKYFGLLIINIVIGSFGVFLILLICEIIECDCFHFNKYIKKNIKQRQLLDNINEELM